MEKFIILQGVRVGIEFDSEDAFVRWYTPNAELAKKPVPEGMAYVDGFVDAPRIPIRFVMVPANVSNFLSAFLSFGKKKGFSSADAKAVPVEERHIAFTDMLKAGMAFLVGERVEHEIIAERIAVCAKPCEHLRKTPTGQYFCHLCGCNLSMDEKLNLAAMVEKTDAQGNITQGCKYPGRKEGKGGWKR